MFSLVQIAENALRNYSSLSEEQFNVVIFLFLLFTRKEVNIFSMYKPYLSFYLAKVLYVFWSVLLQEWSRHIASRVVVTLLYNPVHMFLQILLLLIEVQNCVNIFRVD